MSEIRVANRYAKALMDLARQNDSLEEVHNDAQHFLEVCKDNRDFEVILSNPIIPQHKKYDIAHRVFSEGLSQQTMKFIDLIISKQRGSLLVPIFERFESFYKSIKGITQATVYSPIALSDKIQESLKEIVKKGKGGNVNEVNLENKIDESLLGGFVLQFEDKLLDKSVNTQLKSLKKALKN